MRAHRVIPCDRAESSREGECPRFTAKREDHPKEPSSSGGISRLMKKGSTMQNIRSWGFPICKSIILDQKAIIITYTSQCLKFLSNGPNLEPIAPLTYHVSLLPSQCESYNSHF